MNKVLLIDDEPSVAESVQHVLKGYKIVPAASAAEGIAAASSDDFQVVVVDLKTLKETATVTLAGKPNVIWYNGKRDRLYLAIEDTGVVEVVDCKAVKSVETVPTEVDTKSIAFDPTRQRLYAFLEKTGRVAVFQEV